MKKAFNFLLTVCLLTGSLPGRCQDTLPSGWQPGMQLIKTSCCGMRPGYDSLVISKEKSFYIDTRGKKKIKEFYHFSPSELNTLLEELRQKHFGAEPCKPVVEVTLDRESSSFMLTWPGHFAAACDNDPGKLTEAQRNDLSDINAYLSKLTAHH